MESKAFLALDAHVSSSVLGTVNAMGTILNVEQFATSEMNLILAIKRIRAREKVFIIEESSLADWIRRTVLPFVDDVLVCDPRQNPSISKSHNKNDVPDALALAHLGRLNALKMVYHSTDMRRSIFRSAAHVYVDARNAVTAAKNRIKAKYRQWGLLDVKGTRVYSLRHREMFLERISDPFLRRQFELLYDQLDSRVTAKKEAFVQLEELGKAYSEIQVFQDIPGVGPKGALLFDAMIQTPHRFAKRQSLWRYCKLGVVSRASNGKQIGRRFLDRSGHGILKDVSNRAFRAALNKNDNNEVIQHYERSLLRTHNPVHARLGTQRKILTTMWVLWKNNTTYKPHMFFPHTAPGRVENIDDLLE